MNTVLNINTDAAVVFTNKLERMHKSALPVAIRGALNKAAFDVKQNTMPASAEKHFIQRQKNFFKATSRVEKADGWNINQMKSTVGFIGDQQAVEDLEQQERGGSIPGRSFIPLAEARSGNNYNKKVKPSQRLSRINKIVNAAKSNGRSRQENFVRAAIHAGKGGYVLGNFDNQALWRITSIRRGRNWNTVIKKRKIYSYEKGRSVQVKATSFMKEASLKSGRSIQKHFVAEAERQFEKLYR